MEVINTPNGFSIGGPRELTGHRVIIIVGDKYQPNETPEEIIYWLCNSPEKSIIVSIDPDGYFNVNFPKEK